MRKKKALSVCCIIAFAVSASMGFDLPWGLPRSIAAVCCLAAWLFLGARYPSACLIASVATAVSGTLTGAPFEAMFLSVIAAITAWDLVRMERSLEANAKDADSSQYAALRLRSLVAALAAGTACMLPRYVLKLKLHFFIVVPIVAVTVIFIDRLASRLARAERNGEGSPDP